MFIEKSALLLGRYKESSTRLCWVRDMQALLHFEFIAHTGGECLPFVIKSQCRFLLVYLTQQRQIKY